MSERTKWLLTAWVAFAGIVILLFLGPAGTDLLVNGIMEATGAGAAYSVVFFFTFLIALFIVFLLGIPLLVGAISWHVGKMRRELRENLETQLRIQAASLETLQAQERILRRLEAQSASLVEH